MIVGPSGFGKYGTNEEGRQELVICQQLLPYPLVILFPGVNANG